MLTGRVWLADHALPEVPSPRDAATCSQPYLYTATHINTAFLSKGV
ncbi:hypothetical protein BN1184_BA_00810 [Pantoea ananatis]|nr:hypothetical protein BN1183_BA_01370 [Pantoea ananatis]CRH38779.1 hypothetical protein BN1184_BA_00810 [Pantoea ananatis]